MIKCEIKRKLNTIYAPRIQHGLIIMGKIWDEFQRCQDTIPKCGWCMFEVLLMEHICVPFPTLDKGLVWWESPSQGIF
jgi:hypothetical protein